MAIDDAGEAGSRGGAASTPIHPHAPSRRLPGWGRIILATWLICLLLLGFQQLSLLIFTLSTGR